MVLLPASPSQAAISKRLEFLASRLRWPQYRELIWAMVTPEQWESLAIPKGKQPDPIQIMARVRSKSLALTTVDLSRDVALIGDHDHGRLTKYIKAGGQTTPSAIPRRRRSDARKMVRSQLLGKATHETRVGVKVHISERDGKYMARGSIKGQRFAPTLGSNVAEAEAALIELLGSIERHAFIRPSEAKHLQLDVGPIPRYSIPELCGQFLKNKRSIRGKSTSANYRSRLVPLIEFTDREGVQRRYKFADQINKEFAIEYKTWLLSRMTTRNGHHAAEESIMSPNQVRNCLETVGTMINWAKKPENRCLRLAFETPFTKELIGPKIRKDPVRKNPIEMESRITMVDVMDIWELTSLAISLTLPPRPEELESLLISDVDLKACEFHLGDHLKGRDFNKGRCAYTLPFPEELVPILRHAISDRREGPLLRCRDVANGKKEPKLSINSPEDVSRYFTIYHKKAKPGSIQADQDLKDLFHRMLRDAGGVKGDQLRNAFKSVETRAELDGKRRYYDTRGAVTTDMRNAGVADLELRYLTGHAISDILVEYVGLRPNEEMAMYFKAIKPLLSAIATRAKQLGIQ